MGLTLDTQHWGTGSRRVLLLHGIGSNAAGWWRLGADLAAAGFAVTAPDLRHHGQSPSGPGHTFADYAGDVLAVGSGWEAVIGHSLGGSVAVTAHHREPSFAAGLVLEDPALVLAEEAFDEVLSWLLQPFAGPVDEASVRASNPGWHPEDVRIKAEALRQCGPAVIEETMRANRPWDLLTQTVGVRVATVILGADPALDGIVPVAVGEWLAAENPLIQYRVIRGAPHSLHRDTAGYGRFLDEVLAALERLGGERSNGEGGRPG